MIGVGMSRTRLFPIHLLRVMRKMRGVGAAGERGSGVFGLFDLDEAVLGVPSGVGCGVGVPPERGDSDGEGVCCL